MEKEIIAKREQFICKRFDINHAVYEMFSGERYITTFLASSKEEACAYFNGFIDGLSCSR